MPGQSLSQDSLSTTNSISCHPSQADREVGSPPMGSGSICGCGPTLQKVIKGFLRKEGFKSVSTMKIPAKPAAVRAGLGKYGKNAVVLTERLGSWVMRETLVTDAPLDYEDQPVKVSDCGECDICLKACPTQAIYAPFKINRARCITNWLWGFLQSFEKSKRIVSLAAANVLRPVLRINILSLGLNILSY